MLAAFVDSNKSNGIYIIQSGESASRFLARPGHRREPASCTGGRENSTALQAPQCDQTVPTGIENEVR